MVKIAAALWCLIVALGTPLHSVASDPVKTPIVTSYGYTFSMSGDGDFVAVAKDYYSTYRYGGEVTFYARQLDGSYARTSDTFTGNTGTTGGLYYDSDHIGAARIAVAGDGSVGTRLALSFEKPGSAVRGKVKIYQRTSMAGTGNDWTEMTVLQGKTDRAMFGHYGLQFSSDGSRLIIGAPENGGVGYAQIYHLENGAWTLKLDVSGQAPKPPNSVRGAFGSAATISGDGLTAAVSDYNQDNNGVVRVGVVRIYKYRGDPLTWEHVQDYYGTTQQESLAPHPKSLSLSHDGSRLAIGVPSRKSTDILDYDDATSSYTRESVITGVRDTFGRAVALSDDGDRLAIAAPKYYSTDPSAWGSLKFYEKNGTWSKIAEVSGHQIGGNDQLAVTSDGLRFAALTVEPYDVAIYSLADPVAPGTVNNLTATRGDEEVALSWTAPNDGGSAITDYEYSLDGGSTWTSLSTTGTSATITGLTNGTTYSVSIRAINAVGEGAASEGVSVTPQPGPMTIDDGTPDGRLAEVSPLALSGEFLINEDGSTQAAEKTFSENEFIEISAATDPSLDIALRLDEPDSLEGGANVSEIGVMTYEAGKKGLATGRGFKAGSAAQVFLFSEPRPLGSTVVQQNGTWEKVFDVPTDIELGDHTIQAQGTLPSGARKAATAGVRIAKRSQAPVNLQVSQSASVVDLSWASPNDTGGSAVVDYEYSTNDGAAWRSLGTTGGAADIDSESDAAGTPLADGMVYQIRMRAVTAVGSGEPSAAQALAFVAAPSEPAVPVPSLPLQVLLALLLIVGSLGTLRLRRL